MDYSESRLLGNQRERQISRFRAWVWLVVPIAAVLFDFYVPLFLPLPQFLNMPLLVVMYFALARRSQVSGLLLGMAVGLVQDSLSKNYLGVFGIANTLVGYFAASMGMRIDVERGIVRLMIAFFFYIFHHSLVWVLSRALLGQQIGFELPSVLLQALLNAVVALPLYLFLDKLRENA